MMQLISLIAMACQLYILLVIIWAITSTLISFNIVDRYQPAVAKIMRFLDRMVTPALRPIQRIMPDLGGFDLSPIILIVLLSYIPQLLLAFIDVSHGLAAIIGFIRALLTIYIYCVGIYAVLGLLINLKLVNAYQTLVRILMDITRKLVNKPVMKIRAFVRPIGNVDIAPFVLLIALVLINGALGRIVV